MEGATFIGINTHSDIDLPSLHEMHLSKYLIYSHGIPHNIVSDQRILFTANEEWQWASPHEIHWSHLVLHHSEAYLLEG